jgi:putative transposase
MVAEKAYTDGVQCFTFMRQSRSTQNGKIMFITTNVGGNEPMFENPAHAHEAIDHLYTIKKEIPFELYGFVIMFDHCHFLMKVLPPGKISKVMRTYKMGLTFQIGHGKFWQPRFHMIIPEDPYAVLQYIHSNPVKAGLVDNEKDYRWSSASKKWPVDPLPKVRRDKRSVRTSKTCSVVYN